MGLRKRTASAVSFLLPALCALASGLPAAALPSVAVDVYFTGQSDAKPSGFQRSDAGELWLLETPEFGVGFLTRLVTGVPADSTFSMDPLQSTVAPDTFVAAAPSVTRVPPRRTSASLAAGFVSGDSSGAFVRYRVPTTDAGNYDLEANDAVYFTERSVSQVVRFDAAARRFDEWTIPTTNCYPVAVMALGDTVFFVEAYECRLGRLEAGTNQLTEWTIPNATPDWTGYPGLCRDNSGHIWLTNSKETNLLIEVAIGNGDTAEFHEWAVPGSPFAGPMDVLADSAGRVWYSVEARDENYDTSSVGVFDPARQEYVEWRLPDAGAAPYYLELDTDGNVWVGENGGSAVARLSPSTNEFTTYPIGISRGYVYDYALDGSGNLWIACYDDFALLKFSGVASAVTERARAQLPGDRLAAWPNPFSSRLHCPTRAKCSVYDQDGRLIAEVRNGTWDGRGSDGKEVGAGVYVIATPTGERLSVVKLR